MQRPATSEPATPNNAITTTLSDEGLLSVYGAERVILLREVKP
jgi:hypothetical protein